MGVLLVLLPLALQPSRLTSRRSVIATTLLSPVGASAFDLPPRDGLAGAVAPYSLDDPEACRKYAARPNPDKTRQQAAVIQAISTGDIGSLQAMADGGWSLAEFVDEESGTTMLHRAAKVGDEAAVRLLLKGGSPTEAYTSFMETPLHLAVRNNRLGCVKALVEAGASASALYGKSGGDTAVTLAQKYRFESIVDYFESKGLAPAAAAPRGGDGLNQERECYIAGLFCNR